MIIAIDKAMIDAKSADARDNERLREIHCFHANDDEPLHRMINTIQPGSYIRPHRHIDPPKAESLVILRGAIAVVPFHNDGSIDEANIVVMRAGTDVLGVDMRAGLWHTLVALEPDSTVFEVKPGPYAVSSDKDFAPWAPPESTPEARSFLNHLEGLFQ